MLSQSLPPSPSGRDPYRAAIMGGSPLRALQHHQSRIPAGLSSSSSRGPRASSPQPLPLPHFPGVSRMGSPPAGGCSPPLGPSPTRGNSPRLSPTPRVVREQGLGSGAGDGSPDRGGQGPRGFRAGRMTSLVSQSLDGGLLQAGAAREQQAQQGPLQQVSTSDALAWCACASQRSIVGHGMSAASLSHSDTLLGLALQPQGGSGLQKSPIVHVLLCQPNAGATAGAAQQQHPKRPWQRLQAARHHSTAVTS